MGSFNNKIVNAGFIDEYNGDENMTTLSAIGHCNQSGLMSQFGSKRDTKNYAQMNTNFN
jgi:hypothetical protein